MTQLSPPNSTVYIIDDEALMRTQLEATLQISNISFSSYISAQAFFDDYKKHPQDFYGCIILDYHMPKMNGLELLEKLTYLKCSLPIIMLTATNQISVAVKTMKQGIFDFLEKPFDNNVLLNSVERALKQVADQYQHQQQRIDFEQRLKTMTPRENDVFKLLLKSLSNKHIARELDIQERTVETHRARLLKKLEVKTVSELIHIALTCGRIKDPNQLISE